MTDEHFADDFNFDDPEDSGATEVPQGNRFFGELQFWAFLIGNPFAEAGTYEPFTLPSVMNFDGDALKIFNRQRAKNGKHKFFVLAGWPKNSDGKIYTKAVQYGSWDDEWEEFQYPALTEISPAPRKALVNSGKEGKRLFAQWNEFPTTSLLPENMWKPDKKTGEPVPKYRGYFGDFTFYDTEDAMLAAETEFQAQFDNGEAEEKNAWISLELALEVQSKNPDWTEDTLEGLKSDALQFRDLSDTLLGKKLMLPPKLAAEVRDRAVESTGDPF